MDTEQFPLPVHALFDNLLGLVTPAGVVASRDPNYGAGVFSRDFFLEVLDIDPWMPSFITKGLYHAASYIARTKDELSEARGFGHPAHEVRFEYLGPARVNQANREIIQKLGPQWYGHDDELFYYGAADVIPQFVRVALKHVQTHHDKILQQEIRHIHAPADPTKCVAGKDTYLLRDIVLANVRLLVEQIQESSSGLYEFYRTNPVGHKWKVMRDGALSLMHPDGTLANTNDRIATVELQGLAYDALKLASNFFAAELPKESAVWQELARQLQRATMDRLWIEVGGNEGYFALGLDHNPVTGELRQIQTDSSAQFELLETTIFDDLPESEQVYRIGNLMRRQRSAEFLAAPGLLMTSKIHRRAMPPGYTDYQWDETAWGVTNHIVARGNDYQGFSPLGTDLRNRQVNACAVAGKVREYFYVIDDITYYRYRGLEEGEQASVKRPVIVATNQPEGGQGFTLSGLLRAYFMRVNPVELPQAPQAQAPWRQELLEQLLRKQPVMELLSKEAADLIHHHSPIAAIDTDRGRQIVDELLEQAGYSV